MSVRAMLWIAMGIAAGATHAVALWRSTHASKIQGWGVVWRLPAVAVVLVFAAFAHALLPAVIGWLVGLTTASVLSLVRTRRWM